MSPSPPSDLHRGRPLAVVLPFRGRDEPDDTVSGDPLLGGPGPRPDREPPPREAPTSGAKHADARPAEGPIVPRPSRRERKAEHRALVREAEAATRAHHPSGRQPEEIIDPWLRRAVASGSLQPQRSARPGTLRRTLWPVIVSVVVVGLLFAFVFPTRTWLAQREQTRVAVTRLAELQTANDALTDQISALQTDAEVERLAREQYDLVRPGEQAFAILPAPAPSSLPDGFPFDLVRSMLRPAPANREIVDR